MDVTWYKPPYGDLTHGAEIDPSGLIPEQTLCKRPIGKGWKETDGLRPSELTCRTCLERSGEQKRRIRTPRKTDEREALLVYLPRNMIKAIRYEAEVQETVPSYIIEYALRAQGFGDPLPQGPFLLNQPEL